MFYSSDGFFYEVGTIGLDENIAFMGRSPISAFAPIRFATLFSCPAVVRTAKIAVGILSSAPMVSPRLLEHCPAMQRISV